MEVDTPTIWNSSGYTPATRSGRLEFLKRVHIYAQESLLSGKGYKPQLLARRDAIMYTLAVFTIHSLHVISWILWRHCYIHTENNMGGSMLLTQQFTHEQKAVYNLPL